jgi:hypothetical protein
MTAQRKVPGSSRDGGIDSRSTDASGKQADQVKSHATLANEDRRRASDSDAKDQGERAGAMKDRTAR